MKKVAIVLCSLILFSISSQAALYKGQRVFSKVCLECHTGGESFVGQKTQYEWERYTSNKGERLAKVHLESEKFKKEQKYEEYKKYFTSSKFKKRVRHLKDFLMEYAQDSGNVAACS
jgi:hypothetical protein